MPKLKSSPKAVILVGGPGTRLQPLTYYTPKSMVPVLNKPFMEHTISYLKQFGIEDIILTLKAASKKQILEIFKEADVNGDGKIGVDEAAYLLGIISKN